MKLRDSKYMWAYIPFDEYMKNEAKKMRRHGFKMDTNGASKLLLEKFIIPNKITLTDVLKPKIRLKKKRWTKKGIY